MRQLLPSYQHIQFQICREANNEPIERRQFSETQTFFEFRANYDLSVWPAFVSWTDAAGTIAGNSIVKRLPCPGWLVT